MYALAAVALLALLMWLLNLLANLTASATGSSTAVDAANNTITIRLAEEPPQLDTTLLTDAVSGVVIAHVMEGLLRYDQHQRLVPGMAERWEINAERAVFNLRDALWSDGKPVTAHDFVFAWRTALDPANASQYAFILYPIRNAEAINRGELPLDALGARAEGDRTLVVDLERPGRLLRQADGFLHLLSGTAGTSTSRPTVALVRTLTNCSTTAHSSWKAGCTASRWTCTRTRFTGTRTASASTASTPPTSSPMPTRC